MAKGPPMLWPPERIEEAIREWVWVHGDIPKFSDWRANHGGFPNSTVVCRRFGSWNAAIEAAGYRPRARHRPVSSRKASPNAR